MPCGGNDVLMLLARSTSAEALRRGFEPMGYRAGRRTHALSKPVWRDSKTKTPPNGGACGLRFARSSAACQDARFVGGQGHTARA
jgi:hypothetical protein